MCHNSGLTQGTPELHLAHLGVGPAGGPPSSSHICMTQMGELFKPTHMPSEAEDDHRAGLEASPAECVFPQHVAEVIVFGLCRVLEGDESRQS